MLDSDYADFMANNNIQGIENIEFEFTSCKDESLYFKGKLNGIRNKTAAQQRIGYTFDFTSDQVRKNEGTFVTERYKNLAPEDVCRDIIEEKLEGEIDDEFFNGAGLPMNFLGSRKRPTDIIKYVITHGVTQNSEVIESEDGSQRKGEVKGTTGYLCWQTLEEGGRYRMASVDDIKGGKGGKDSGEFISQTEQNELTLEASAQSIITYEFKELGDFQARLRSGAFKSKNIFMDLDKGVYTEDKMEAEEMMTDKQKEALKESGAVETRTNVNVVQSQLYEPGCEGAQPDQWDQTKRNSSQNQVNQNTFDDQTGQLTLSPQFEMRAGDTITVKIPKVVSEGEGGYEEKTTGRYICKQVAHHMHSNGAAYTKVGTVRTTIQQEDFSSTLATAEGARAVGRAAGERILSQLSQL